jgi:hypothetical protein
MVNILYGNNSYRDSIERSSSLGIKAYLLIKFLSTSGESVRDQAKIKIFTRINVIVIIGKVWVGTLSFNGIIEYSLP